MASSPKKPKPTEAQGRMLSNIRAGRNAGEGFPSGATASQAAHQVACALIKRGWLKMTNADVGPAYTLTEAGWDALEAYEKTKREATP